MFAAAAIGPGDWLTFQIVSPKGMVLKDYGSHLPNPKRPWDGDYVNIGPGKPYKEIVPVYPSLLDTGTQWPESGTYRVKAIYSYKQKSTWKYGRDLWQGKIESNWSTVKVK